MSDRVFWSIVTGIGGLILIGISAGPLASLGVFLCMVSHHLEKHLSNVLSVNISLFRQETACRTSVLRKRPVLTRNTPRIFVISILDVVMQTVL